MRKKLLALMMVIILLFSFTGCGRQALAESQNRAPADKVMDSVYEEGESPSSMVPAEKGSVQNRKLIRTMSMEAETDNLAVMLVKLKEKVLSLGGYIENMEQRENSTSSHSYRYANLTIRIPVGEMDSFVEHVGTQSNITYRQESSEDVTLTYVATESRMKALETEQARLLELLAQAGTMEDLLQIEKRLTEVRTELEKVTSQLRLYDNLVDFGTVHLSLRQVTEFTDTTVEPTIWQRIGSGFVSSLKGLWTIIVEVFVFIVVASPYLAMVAGIVFLVIWIIKKKKNG